MEDYNKIWSTDQLYLIQTPINLITIGWNAYVITKVGGVTNIYINSSTTSAVSSTQTMVSPTLGTSVNVGIAFKYTSTTFITSFFCW
jgi:hypothetical protein